MTMSAMVKQGDVCLPPTTLSLSQPCLRSADEGKNRNQKVLVLSRPKAPFKTVWGWGYTKPCLPVWVWIAWTFLVLLSFFCLNLCRTRSVNYHCKKDDPHKIQKGGVLKNQLTTQRGTECSNAKRRSLKKSPVLNYTKVEVLDKRKLKDRRWVAQ